jgi:hypothetical protein
MNEVEINKQAKLSEHFKLGELHFAVRPKENRRRISFIHV